MTALLKDFRMLLKPSQSLYGLGSAASPQLLPTPLCFPLLSDASLWLLPEHSTAASQLSRCSLSPLPHAHHLGVTPSGERRTCFLTIIKSGLKPHLSDIQNCPPKCHVVFPWMMLL